MSSTLAQSQIDNLENDLCDWVDGRPKANPNSIKDIIARIPEDLMPLVPGFVARREQDVVRLRAFLKNSDFNAIKYIGHRLKGSGGGYGFEHLSDIGSRLEVAGQSHDRNNVADLIDELLEEIFLIKSCL